jgi:predicted O-methyltransferase YrrM
MDVQPLSPAGGGALRLITAAVGARAVVEIGTGTGVSGLYLLRGMRPDGVLTTVDQVPDRQQVARAAFTTAGFAANRSRFILGRALDVLPRLADGQYDLVFCDADPAECLDYLAEALRLLRTGGAVCFAGVLRRGLVTNPAAQDPLTRTVRQLVREVRTGDVLTPALLPVGDGLLCGVKR